MEQIHQVLENFVHTYHLQETYADDAYPWMGILAADAFSIHTTYHQS